MKKKSNRCLKKYSCNNFSCSEVNEMRYKSLSGEKEGKIALEVRTKPSANHVLIITHVYKIKLNEWDYL